MFYFDKLKIIIDILIIIKRLLCKKLSKIEYQKEIIM